MKNHKAPIPPADLPSELAPHPAERRPFLSGNGAGASRLDTPSESRLKLALSAARMGVWEWDMHTSSVFLSPECFAIIGIETFGGRVEDIWRLVHPEDLDRVLMAAGRALSERSSFAPEFRTAQRDGKVQWLSVIGHFTHNEKDEARGMVGTVQDITERKNGEDELRRTHAEMHLLSTRLLEAQEAGRRDLARELEEGVRPALASATTLLHAVRGSTKADQERVAESLQLMERLMGQVQQIAVAPRPSILGEFAPAREALSQLTPRQREILQLIAEGMSTKEIAFLLKRSAKTVEAHRAQIMDRLRIHDLAGLVRVAIRCGLVSMDR